MGNKSHIHASGIVMANVICKAASSLYVTPKLSGCHENGEGSNLCRSILS